MNKHSWFLFALLNFTLNLCYAPKVNHLQGIVYPLQPGTWISGVFENSTEKEYFSFEALENKEYLIIVSLGSLNYFGLTLFDKDGTSVITQNDPWRKSSKYIQWKCSSSGTYFVSISPENGSTGTFDIGIQTASERLNYLVTLLKGNQCQEALNEQLDFLKIMPDDPETNLYTAILRLINLIETPDNRLLNIYKQFSIDFDLFPAGSRITNPTDTMMRVSEIQSYAVENILPVIDQSLLNLEKVINHPDISAFVPPINYEKKIYPGEKDKNKNQDNYSAETGWVQIDNTDVKIMAGVLLLAKSTILSLNAFDMGIEPKIISERYYPNPTDPVMLDTLLIEYPDLLTGKRDIKEIFRSSLQNWLLGTQKIREGLDGMNKRNTPQDVHIVYLNTTQEAQSIARYLSLLDRVFAGLLTVTGGDFNGDSVVDYWDLHELGSTIRFKH